MLTIVCVIDIGAVNCTSGELYKIFVSFVAKTLLLPQLDVYATLMLSPIEAAAVLVYFILMVCEPTVPESKTPVEPTFPIGNDHA